MNERQYRIHLMLCAGLSCASSGSFEVKKALEKELHSHNLQDEVLLVMTGCNGFCPHGPTMVVQPDNILYHFLKAEDIPHLVEEHFLKGRPVKDLMFVPSPEEFPIPRMSDIGFFNKQRLVVFRNRGQIDPENIEEYIARGGYKALAKVLTSMTPDEVIQEMKQSGLRGRGGAGFPTGLKWEICRKAKGNPKYIICNADEGDPGAYMDRAILEGDPHTVLEGLLIGAYAIGASQGYIYIRSEYPLAVVKKQRALDQAREYGLVGEDIFGTDFSFDIKIMQGSGAFVCGEETSLIASLEGKRPEPRTKPPFPAEYGVWGKPTNINNVETWANVPVIMQRGAKWFSEIGTEKSKGTKIFSLVGKINNTGLVEVPMGTTLREIVYDIGGGIPDNKKFKAVQTGGPSGGCIPAKLIDIPIDYERLAEVGSIMGSGGMIIVDEDTCMVDIAKYFIQFTTEESCGKCTSCREGSQALLEILTRITNGEGEESDIELLRELSEAIKDASLCGLGKTLPNPVLSTLEYFMEEYEQHIKYKRCPAVVCKGIISSACQHTCPLGQDVPCYTGFIVQGKFKEAIEIVRKENPLPLICGRVCHHPCEDKCRAGEAGGDPIAIRSLKRFLADYELEHRISIEKKPKQARDERIAVIGSGPAGLTCAHYLGLYGYRVTIFEQWPVPGGMLAVGIPEYRLPKDILKFEIENIERLGVEIRTNIRVGKDISVSDLRKEYKAIFIAVGAHKGLRLGIPGEDSEGVVDAVEFLRKVNLGQDIEIGGKVVVIGGGNAAVDAARVAKRLDKNVQIVYRRTRAEMPADKEEVEQVINEGIDIQFLTTPVRVISDNGRLTAIECIKMRLGDMDESGRRRPIPIEGSEFRVELDTLIPAIGQESDLSFTNGNGLRISKQNTIEVDPETLYTNEEGVFAGGDVVTRPKTITDAMGHGKIAAQMIHKYIQGKPVEREYKVTRPAIYVEAAELTDEEIEQLKKPQMPTLPIDERRNFKEVELGFSREQAIAEAKRCLRCDLEQEE